MARGKKRGPATLRKARKKATRGRTQRSRCRGKSEGACKKLKSCKYASGSKRSFCRKASKSRAKRVSVP